MKPTQNQINIAHSLGLSYDYTVWRVWRDKAENPERYGEIVDVCPTYVAAVLLASEERDPEVIRIIR